MHLAAQVDTLTNSIDNGPARHFHKYIKQEAVWKVMQQYHKLIAYG